MIDLEALGIYSAEKRLIKFSPNPKDVRPARKSLNLLNDKFYKEGNSDFEEVVFYAFMPWENNPDKRWVLLCTSLPLLHSKQLKKWICIIRSKFPGFNFKVSYFYSSDYYFKIIDAHGVLM